MIHIARGLLITKSIVLVGIMGAGKTTVGSRLAKKLNLEFYDTDSLVEEKVGCSIQEIMKYAGEDFFKNKEKEVISEVLSGHPKIISTGGGAFFDKSNRELIKEKAISVWLKADLNVIVERVSRRNTRPMLEGEAKGTIIKNLVEEMYPIYSESNICVNSDNGPHMIIVDEILNKLKDFFKSA